MRPLFTAFIFFVLGMTVSAQTNRWGFGFEYSPNFSNATRPFYVDSDNGFRLAQNGFLKAYYHLSPKLDISAGGGYLEAVHSINGDFPQGADGLYRIESVWYHHYLVFPVGVQYHFGHLFVEPAVGIGWNFANVSHDTYYYHHGSNESSVNGPERHPDEFNFYRINEITYPVFLSLGYAVPLSGCSLSFGLQGYYGLNFIGERIPMQRHYYGTGITLGIKW
jgi:hypothetical protein